MTSDVLRRPETLNSRYVWTHGSLASEASRDEPSATGYPPGVARVSGFKRCARPRCDVVIVDRPGLFFCSDDCRKRAWRAKQPMVPHRNPATSWNAGLPGAYLPGADARRPHASHVLNVKVRTLHHWLRKRDPDRVYRAAREAFSLAMNELRLR